LGFYVLRGVKWQLSVLYVLNPVSGRLSSVSNLWLFGLVSVVNVLLAVPIPRTPATDSPEDLRHDMGCCNAGEEFLRSRD
jgi:hypothetical protein